MLGGHLLLAILWAIFGILHSVLAGSQLKKHISKAYPRFYKNYRFFYTVFAFLSMTGVILYGISLTSPLLFASSELTDISGIVISGIGLVVMIICIRKYFLSLSGLKSLFAEQVVANELRVDGVHRYVRHPLYLGTFLFIWGAWLFIPYASLLVSNIVITVYTLIGIYFEEKKLVEEFGEDYRAYRRRVPMIIPFI